MEIGSASPTLNFLRPTASGGLVASKNDATGKMGTEDETIAAENKDPLKDPRSTASQQLQELKSRDREVRAHEQAHLAASGGYATGGPTYTYQQGPDGRRYAVGGEVQIDTSKVSGDPEATIQKMRTVQTAALAPAEPSSQDRAVAAQAATSISEARQDLSQDRLEEKKSTEEASPEEESEAANDDGDNESLVADSQSNQNNNIDRYNNVVSAAEETQQNVLDLIA